MRAIFEVAIIDGVPDTPPFQAEKVGDPQLYYAFDKDGAPQAGGYWLVNQEGVPEGKVRIEIDASPESIAVWKAGGVFLWVEDQ